MLPWGCWLEIVVCGARLCPVSDLSRLKTLLFEIIWRDSSFHILVINMMNLHVGFNKLIINIRIFFFHELDGLNCLIDSIFPHFFSIWSMIHLHLLLMGLHLRIGCIVKLFGGWTVNLIGCLETTNRLSLCWWWNTTLSYNLLFLIEFNILTFWRGRLLLLYKVLEVRLLKITCFWRWRHQSA